MSDQVTQEVRAMLALFERSDWRDLHLRTERVELFMARDDGVANPMAGTASSGTEICAPHLATLVSLLPEGTTVLPGESVAVIEMLGQAEDILADEAGTIAAHCAVSGSLVEYGQPLLLVTP